MARLSNSPFAPASTQIRTDPLQDLNRLLDRLSRNILYASADAERRLKRDEFERTKVRYNIDAARVALTRLEQDALPIKIHQQRQEVQADLSRKRELIEQLRERVQDLEDMGAEEDEDDEDSEGEDLLADIIPTPSETTDARSTDASAEEAPEQSGEERDWESEAPDQPPERPLAREKTGRRSESGSVMADGYAAEKAGTITSSTLRSRGRHFEPEPEPEPAGDTVGTLAAKLFEGQSTTTALPGTATEEAILDSHRREQEALSDDILRLAQALKSQSMTTARLLDEDKSIVDRVAEGLDTTDTGMDAAGRKMGTLTRMTEGKGWWGRMLLFGMVWGMMLLLVLIFLFLPKLRF